jgi:hypothetical protein
VYEDCRFLKVVSIGAMGTRYEIRTPGAKALINPAIYGTAEAVPFVRSSFVAGGAYWMDPGLVRFSRTLKPIVFVSCMYGLKPVPFRERRRTAEGV